MSGTILINYEQTRTMLAACSQVDEVKPIRDKAEALRAYARQAGDHELETWAAEIKLRANRRIGEISRTLDASKGGKNPKATLPPSGRVKVEVLRAAGLTTQVASRCEQIAAIPEKEFETFIAEKKAKCKPVTSVALLSLAKQFVKKTAQAEAQAPADNPCTPADLYDLVARGRQFGTIYADPPWPYSNQGTRASTKNHYATMTVDEIARLPVGQLAADCCHLHLWTTNAFLFECPRLFEAWGFAFQGVFVWCKPQLGIGNCWRVSHEFCLLAIRGDERKFAKGARNLRSWAEVRRGRHSAKPEQVRQMIEKASPGPRLELFARRAAPGWTPWGDQITHDLFTRPLEGD